MNKPVKVKRPATRRVVDTSVKTAKLSAEEVAEALGAIPGGSSCPELFRLPLK